MVFSSLTFLVLFLPLFCMFYFGVGNNYRNIVLVLFSCIFFAWGEPVYIFILLISSLIDYTAGRLIYRYREKPVKKYFLWASLIMNIGLLAYFKYIDFFIGSINNISNLNISLRNVALPLGISFFTFQTMSYTIDIYKDEIPVQKDFIKFMAYVTMFPQLVAGPIVRYADIVKEIDERKVSLNKFLDGFYVFILGFIMKVFFANQISVIADGIFNMEDISKISMTTAWIGAIAYAFQIYFDFAGYSTMAIGIGKMIGFTFPQNFNYPYSSKSITEFWRRWHISLGKWFRDYVYIPLGGNRVSNIKWLRNILIVWFLTGMWHGAAWNYILWGLFYGTLLVVEKVFLKNILEKVSVSLQWLYTSFFVLIGWVIFRNEDISRMTIYLKKMFSFENILDVDLIVGTREFIVLFILCGIFSLEWSKKIIAFFHRRQAQVIPMGMIVLTLILCFSMLIDGQPNPFIYFRF